ncbi:MAG: peptide-methionine (S)-S-oxide reductase MsrA [Cyanobacteriota bacterium]|mgnify:CR=1 FL=1
MTLETISLGAGCFWCVEAIFQRFNGVKKVESGYMGGKIENPTYKQVCTGTTGHAEIIKIDFDNEIITLDDILEAFWQTHNPTTLNKQGGDEGTQYRSAIFYYNENQKKIAEESKNKFKSSFSDPIVTEITQASVFYKAEDYHQNYYNDNSFQPYCSFVISPKIKKLKEKFESKLSK